MENKKCAAVNYAGHPHYNDHLAPISSLMKMPLLLVESEEYEDCKKYYPDIEPVLLEYEEFSPEYLIQNFDVLFMSDLWDRDVFSEKFCPLEEKYKKIIRNVHVPHGYSDKGFYLKKAAKEDITLIYGQNMLDMLRDEQVDKELHRYVLTGNYRYTYYMQHREFFDRIAEEKIFGSIEKREKVIFYAPTWMDLEESSSFFEYTSYVLDKIPEEYTVILKPHPQLELDDVGLFYQILGKYRDNPQVHIVTDFQLIYPMLNKIDIYLGDMSSIGYDFLAFNRPMFFLNKDNRNVKNDRRSLLMNCGVDIKRARFGDLYEIIGQNISSDKEVFGQVRKEMYEYTFGKEKSFEEIRKEIAEAYNAAPTYR